MEGKAVLRQMQRHLVIKAIKMLVQTRRKESPLVFYVLVWLDLERQLLYRYKFQTVTSVVRTLQVARARINLFDHFEDR